MSNPRRDCHRAVETDPSCRPEKQLRREILGGEESTRCEFEEENGPYDPGAGPMGNSSLPDVTWLHQQTILVHRSLHTAWYIQYITYLSACQGVGSVDDRACQRQDSRPFLQACLTPMIP